MEEDEAATAPARDGRGASPPAPSLALPMDRAILAGDTLAAARALVGATLVRDDATGRRAARIEEVEAYVGEDDRASHARFGRTRRNGVMWGTAGLAYVYLVYGMYDCLNVVTGREGFPAAVLVRAALPIEGTELMRAARIEHLLRRRRLDAAAIAAETARMRSLPGDRLARGPGVLAAAFGLDRMWTGADLCDPASPLRLEAARREGSAPVIVATRRVGIAYAGEPWVSVPWRFVAERDAHAPMNRHGDPAVGREEDPDPAAARDAGGAR